jgi:lysyl-tRNA synthetase, class I
MTYELFLDDQGQKISKSKGNGLTIDEWLTYAATESLSYFMYQKPKTAKRMHFDVIPRAVDEYHQQLRAYPTQDVEAQVNNPVWHIHEGKPPESRMVVSFGMLLNLASVSSAKDAKGLVGLHQALCAGCLARDEPGSGCGGGLCGALFRRPDRADAGVPAADRSGAGGDGGPAGAAGGLGWGLDDEALQSMVFAVGKEHGFEPLRDWFKALYEVLLGASDGPRFGGFIALYGVEETVALMERALKGELVA